MIQGEPCVILEKKNILVLELINPALKLRNINYYMGSIFEVIYEINNKLSLMLHWLHRHCNWSRTCWYITLRAQGTKYAKVLN